MVTATLPHTARAQTRSLEPSARPTTASPSRANTDSALQDIRLPNLMTRSVMNLNPYEPAHIGPLIAKEFQAIARGAQSLRRSEALLGGIIGGSSIAILAAVAEQSFFTPAYLLAALGTAVLSGATTWLGRKHLGTAEARVVKQQGAMNFSTHPLYETALEAREGALNAPASSLTQAISLRHALTHGPLLDPQSRSINAAFILLMAQKHFPDSLLHIDATLEAAASIGRRSTSAEISLLSHNVHQLCERPDVFEQVRRSAHEVDQEVRRSEVLSWLPQFTERLFHTKFDEPRAQCEALHLVRNMIETVLDRTGRNPSFQALRDNTIEALLGHIPSIPSPADRLAHLERAAKVKGLEKDQRALIAELIETIKETRQFTATEEQHADEIIALVRTPQEPKSEARRKAA